MNADDLCMYLIYNAHVSVVTGKAFGNESCVRISYAASEEKLIEGLKRIKEALSLLN
jgi:aspartate aminotransferase